MKMNKTKVPLTLGSGTMWLATLFLAGCANRPAIETMLIGHIAPLSGPRAVVGKHGQQGLQLAVEDTNQDDKQGTVSRVAVAHVDSQDESTTLVAQATRLVTINKVAGLIASADTQGIDKLARAIEPFTLPLVVRDPIAVRSAEDTVFSVCLAPVLQGQVLARFATQEQKWKRIGVLIDSRRTVAGIVADAFFKECGRAKTGAPHLDSWTYSDSSRFGDLVERIKKSAADAICIAGAAGDLAVFRKALQNAGVNPLVIYGGEETGMEAVLADQEMNQGTILATSYVAPVGEGPSEGQAFVKRYRERFGDPPDLYAVLAYDAGRILFETVRKIPAPSGAAARQELANLENVASLTGPLTFKGGVTRRTAFVVRLEAGQLKLLRAYKPGED
jgi:branched-chain amino acid transport system substrate-binding protein